MLHQAGRPMWPSTDLCPSTDLPCQVINEIVYHVGVYVLCQSSWRSFGSYTIHVTGRLPLNVWWFSIHLKLFLLAPKMFRTFSQFYKFYTNNYNNIPYISISGVIICRDMSRHWGWNDVSLCILHSSYVKSTNLFSFIWILNLYKLRNTLK